MEGGDSSDKEGRIITGDDGERKGKEGRKGGKGRSEGRHTINFLTTWKKMRLGK